MKFSKPNRANKRKLKKGSGCKMCKCHKGKWSHFFKDKIRAILKRGKDESRDATVHPGS